MAAQTILGTHRTVSRAASQKPVRTDPRRKLLKIAFALFYSMMTYCYSTSLLLLKRAYDVFTPTETVQDDDMLRVASAPRSNSFSVFESVTNMRGKSRKTLALFDGSFPSSTDSLTEPTDVLQHHVCGKPALLATRASIAECEVNVSDALETADKVYENQHYMVLGWYGRSCPCVCSAPPSQPGCRVRLRNAHHGQTSTASL